MLPILLDINTDQDASTTLFKEQVEFRVQTIPTYFEQDLVSSNDFMKGELISVFTNLSISNRESIEYINESSELSDDFDLVSKFEFKKTGKITARIKKTEFTPAIILD